MMNNLSAQLKALAITPRPEWKSEARFALLEKARKDVLLRQRDSEQLTLLKSFRLANLAWKPALAYALGALVFLGASGLTVVTANHSVPGDNLFVVKRALEKSKDFVTTGGVRKTELASAFLGNRVNDLEKSVLKRSVLVSAGQASTGNLILALREVQKQVSDVEFKFDEMRADNAKNGKKVALAALKLNDEMRDYRHNLKSVKDQLDDQEVSGEFEKVLDNVTEIDSNVLALIVDKHQSGEIDIASADLASRLGSHIKDIADKVAAVSAKESESSANILQQVSQVRETLARANTALSNSEYSLVLTLAKDTNQMLTLMYGEISKVEKGSSGDGASTGATDQSVAGETASSTDKLLLNNNPRPAAASSTAGDLESHAKLGDEYLLVPEVDRAAAGKKAEEFKVGID